jgi:hypothetical protein
MESHNNDAGVQYQGCSALGNLAANNAKNKVAIADAGGIGVVVSGMKAHQDHAGVQAKGCWALATLAFSNIENKVAIAKTGGIIAIARGMKAHLNQADVQKYGCRALSVLAVAQDDNRLAIAKAGGIAAIVNDMEAHNHHVGVQEWGCLALYNLSFNAKVALLIEVGGGVQVLEAASSYPYAGSALEKIQRASIPREKLPSGSAKIRRDPMQDPEEPANGRNGWFRCILELCKNYQEQPLLNSCKKLRHTILLLPFPQDDCGRP